MIDQQDKSTVISLFPLPITEEKPGIYPGRFFIPACTGSPVLVEIGQSVHYVDVGEDRPMLQVTYPSIEIARSIVEDFIRAQLAVSDDGTVRPGLTWLRGSVSTLDLKSKHAPILKTLQAQHHAWLTELVKLADDDWEKYHKHTVVSELQRIAARCLGFTGKEKEYLLDFIPEAKSESCPACGSQVSGGIIVCPFCRCILDKEKYSQLAFAK